MTSILHHQMDSPIGVLTLLSDGSCLTGLYMGEHAGAAAAVGRSQRSAAAFRAVTEQLDAYFAGQLQGFDVPTAAQGTVFQQKVWFALCTIPYGTTVTYRDIAEQIGAPKAVRAVGLANGRNPISIIVPCHRVIGANGSLTGYGGGLDRKRVLLDLEAAASQPALFAP